MPPPGDLASFGAAWLGWDAARGASVAQPEVAGIEAATEAPRKYGLHGTLKPPFRLAEGTSLEALDAAVAALAGDLAPVVLQGLTLGALGHFLALVPAAPSGALATLASRCVTDLDRFRAPLSDADLARRRKAGLTERQEALLQAWGYPYVMEEFRFHLTLTGRLDPANLDLFKAEITARLPVLPEPYVMDRIALCEERADGRFVTVKHYTLSG